MELDIEIRIYDWGENNYKLHIKNEEEGDTLTYADNKDLDECLKHIEDYIHGISKGQSSVEDNDEDREEIIRLFKEQPWFEEWRKEYALHPSSDETEEEYLDNTSPFSYVSSAFEWEKSEKGCKYWSDISDEWNDLLIDNNFKVEDYEE